MPPVPAPMTIAITAVRMVGVTAANMTKLVIVWRLTSPISHDPHNHSLDTCHFSYVAHEESDPKSITTKPHQLLRSVLLVNTPTGKSKFYSPFEAWQEPTSLVEPFTHSDLSLPIWPTDRCLNFLKSCQYLKIKSLYIHIQTSGFS